MENIIICKDYDYLSRSKAIKSLCEKFGFIKKSVIGKSCGGKDIIALKIGAANTYSLFVAGVHGSEHITSTVCLMFMEELCHAISNGGYIAGINARRALNGRGLIFVPCLNPDGCDISLLGEKACGNNAGRIANLCNNDFAHWNANLRGVDLNHNFDAGWAELRKKETDMGIYGPSRTRFGGFKPHSEPETVALVELCRKNNMRYAMALHSQGEVIYWNYGNATPPKSRKIAEILATSSKYALDTPISIVTGGGFKDWFIKEFNRPGFTVEIGKGENPLPCSQAISIYNNIREMLMLFSVM